MKRLSLLLPFAFYRRKLYILRGYGLANWPTVIQQVCHHSQLRRWKQTQNWTRFKTNRTTRTRMAQPVTNTHTHTRTHIFAQTHTHECDNTETWFLLRSSMHNLHAWFLLKPFSVVFNSSSHAYQDPTPLQAYTFSHTHKHTPTHTHTEEEGETSDNGFLFKLVQH